MSEQHDLPRPIATDDPIAGGLNGQLSEDQVAAVTAFIHQLGGIENARRAIAALKAELKHAA